jgi:hypothetical protein
VIGCRLSLEGGPEAMPDKGKSKSGGSKKKGGKKK